VAIRRKLVEELDASHPDLEDVTQDAWWRFCRRWRSWEASASFERFARAFARYALKDYFRALERCRRGRTDTPPPDAYPGNGPAGPEGELFAREVLELCIATIDGLPPRQRRVIELHAGGLGYRQIADHLGMAPGAVRKHLHDARKTLLDVLLDSGYDWPSPGFNSRRR